ncbi:MAG: hypothetical protein AAFP93_02490, partial [Bacteroidota bacterium]
MTKSVDSINNNNSKIMHHLVTLWLRGATSAAILFVLHACAGKGMLLEVTYPPKKEAAVKSQESDSTIVSIPYIEDERSITGLLLGGSPDDEDSDGEDRKVYSATQHRADVKHSVATSKPYQGSTATLAA